MFIPQYGNNRFWPIPTFHLQRLWVAWPAAWPWNAECFRHGSNRNGSISAEITGKFFVASDGALRHCTCDDARHGPRVQRHAQTLHSLKIFKTFWNLIQDHLSLYFQDLPSPYNNSWSSAEDNRKTELMAHLCSFRNHRPETGSA